MLNKSIIFINFFKLILYPLYNFRYVVMENLRAFLYAYSPESPVYFGSKSRQHGKQVLQLTCIEEKYIYFEKLTLSILHH